MGSTFARGPCSLSRAVALADMGLAGSRVLSRPRLALELAFGPLRATHGARGDSSVSSMGAFLPQSGSACRPGRAYFGQPSVGAGRRLSTSAAAAADAAVPSTPLLRQSAPIGGGAGPPPAAAAAFAATGLGPEVQAAVAALGLTTPTEIQAAAIPRILAGGDVLLASHTGSGKTLAYLLPIIELLRRDEQAAGGDVVTRPKHPRAIVLGPTRELTQQVLAVAKSLCHVARFRAAGVGGGAAWRVQREALARPVDILVATPGRLLQHIEEGSVHLGDVRCLVLDEADTMLDSGFGPDVLKVLGPVRAAAARAGRPPGGVVLVAATLTSAVTKLVEATFPAATRVATSSLHRAVPAARHSFVDAAAGRDRVDTLLGLLAAPTVAGLRTMVFCNTVAACRAIEHALSEAGLTTACYHGEVPAAERVAAIVAFRDGGDGAGAPPPPVLVCTDLAARGLDFGRSVDHVVNFDFPLNPVDYLHRTGRTARAGAKGRVTSLVCKGDRVLAGAIRDAIARGATLESLSSDKAIADAEKQRQAAERKEARGRAAGRAAGRAGSSGPSRGRDSPSSSPRGRRERPAARSESPRGSHRGTGTEGFREGNGFDVGKRGGAPRQGSRRAGNRGH